MHACGSNPASAFQSRSGSGVGAAARVHVKVRWRFRGRVEFRDAVRAKVSFPPGLSGARLCGRGTGLLGVQVPHRIAGGASRTRAAGGWME